jgi:hypothetical protein
MARRDFSHAWLVCNDCKTGWKREGWQSCSATELLKKKHQNGHQNVIFLTEI